MKTYLCLDIGGSKYMVGLIRRDGEVVAVKKGVWEALTRESILETLLREARAMMREYDIRPDMCGITIPGLADPEKGMWVEASFSGIRDFPICEIVSKELDMPCYCDNDAQAYSLAERIFGCCRDVNDFLFVNVSNGIGGSIYSNGRLLYGAHGNAGEFGHCVIKPDGRMCKCGSRGCLEMHAAGPGIAKNYAEAGGAIAGADAKTIADQARNGEATAITVFEQEGEMLGSVISKAINLLNPRRVVIGGGVSLAFDLFGPALKRTVAAQVYKNANPDYEIVPTPLGYTAGLYCAAAIAVYRTETI